MRPNLLSFSPQNKYFIGGFTLRKGIHPEYKEATVTCACGNSIQTHSTVGDMHVEICSACHPFYTGKQKLVDTAGRVEKYRKRYKLDQKKAETEQDVQKSS